MAILMALAAQVLGLQACHDALLHEVFFLFFKMMQGRLILPQKVTRSSGRRAADIHVTLPSLTLRSAAGLGRPGPCLHLHPKTGRSGCAPPRPTAPP